MPHTRLAVAVAASLAAAAFAAPAHASRPASHDAVTVHPATSAGLGSAERRKKKWVLSYTISTFMGGPAFDYAWRLTTIHGVPVRGVKVYQQILDGKRFQNEGTTYVTDANGQFHFYSCNGDFPRERMYVKATKKRKAVTRVSAPQLRHLTGRRM